jgi:replicative DNA helicase
MPESSFESSSFEDRLASELSNHSALPHSVEAEQSVLGGLMLDNNRLDAVLEVVSEADFFRDDHKLIFRMMIELQEAGQPLDVITLSEELHKHDELERVGGLGYLVEMANNTPSAANIAAYAKIVRERSTLRQLIAAAQEISKSSMNPAGLDSDDLLQLAEKRVAEIAEDRPKEGGLVGVNELLKALPLRQRYHRCSFRYYRFGSAHLRLAAG